MEFSIGSKALSLWGRLWILQIMRIHMEIQKKKKNSQNSKPSLSVERHQATEMNKLINYFSNATFWEVLALSSRRVMLLKGRCLIMWVP